MLKQAENSVKIEGILSEIDLKYSTFMKNNVETHGVGGSIKVRVDTIVNGVQTQLEIPVHMFATKTTKNGGANPAYESIERVMNEYVSIAASDIDRADRVRITRGQIGMNEYYGQNGNLPLSLKCNCRSFLPGCYMSAQACCPCTMQEQTS